MKVVHINTFDVGGAATSALRLHEGLLQQQVNSVFLCLHKSSEKPANKIKFSVPYTKQSITERIVAKTGISRPSQTAKNEAQLKRLEGTYEKFSFPFTDYCVEKDALLQQADIIHLHWIADFVNYPVFFSTVQKPVVWTMHDMNPILGGFHYKGDVLRNNEVFEQTEQEFVNVKAQAVALVNNMVVATPSAWLNKAARESVVFKRASFAHIPYGLDCSVFKPHDKRFSANVFNLPIGKKIILFVCENIHTYRKGFDLLLEAVKQVKLKEEYILVTVGEPGALLHNDFFYNIGTIRDERLMSLLYAAADLFVLPSREDNFPNVMLEAFACGTPVLSFNTGGMAEVIKEGFNGLFARNMDATSLACAIKKFCDGNYMFNREEIRRYAKDKFSLELQALQYKKLYEEMLVNTA